MGCINCGSKDLVKQSTYSGDGYGETSTVLDSVICNHCGHDQSKKATLVVSFSGGKTSAFMTLWLQLEFSHIYDLVFCFANTGREHEKTLEFVKECDERFCLNLNWLEAEISPIKGEGVSHRVVDYTSASRKGEPFEAFISKEGVPNVSKATCSERLKTFVIKDFMRKNGLLRHGRKGARVAIGMRPERCRKDSNTAKRHNLVYPLAHWCDHTVFDKQYINDFWEGMPFTLCIPERYGNCLTCFKKSDNKLKLIAREHPEWFIWNDEMETKYGNGHVFFRQKRSTKNLLGVASMMDLEILRHLNKHDPDSSNGCAGSSCEAFQ